MSSRAPSRPSRRLTNTLRIIGGQWRGRKLEFPAIEAIRPTPDRVRETVFNWLQHSIVGAHCLDLFAGSGALSFEALSRGAASATLVERDKTITTYLRDTATRLSAQKMHVICADANSFVATPSGNHVFDIVFLDPPFAEKLLPTLCQQLERSGRLANSAFIYMEAAATDGSLSLPSNWTLLKAKSAGQVGYYLARRDSAPLTQTT